MINKSEIDAFYFDKYTNKELLHHLKREYIHGYNLSKPACRAIIERNFHRIFKFRLFFD